MKEPWEIFLDELKREARRRGRMKDGLAEVTTDQFQDAVEAAWRATAYHLVEVLHWREGDASVLGKQFAESIGSGPPPDVALRRAWEEWQRRH